MLFRSRALLDQDQAVRSANLAKVYGDAGLYQTSLSEASRAVTYDYANYSAHLFLANSYYALLDPARFNLRNETVWFNELLLANLLAPVGAGALSPNISQQEYSRFFASRGVGLSSTTTLRSDEDYREIASQFGRFDRFDYSLDIDYQDRQGVGANNDLHRFEWFSQIKLELTPVDRLFLLTKYQQFEAGDNFQYYDPAQERNQTFRFTDDQAPLLAVGYDHAWRPEVHTLALGGWMRTRMRAEQQDYGAYRFSTNAAGAIVRAPVFPFRYQQESAVDLGTIEVQQIVQHDRQLLLLGGRAQAGTIAVDSLVEHGASTPYNPNWLDPVSDVSTSEPLTRFAAYGYYTIEARPELWLTAGVSYDWLEYPRNWRHLPVASGTDQTSQWSPKAGLVWSLSPAVTVRAAYAQSMAGVTLEDSFRLEPAQLAGFPQAFRTLISERLVGSVAAPAHEVAAAALDLGTNHWYATVTGGWLGAHVDRSEGSFWRLQALNSPVTPGEHQVDIRYEEVFARASLSRLLGSYWVAGGGVQFTHSTFDESVQAAFDPLLFPNGLGTRENSDLWRGFLFGVFNHPTGLFGRLDLNWYAQENSGPKAPGPGDSFPMIDLEAGYRFWNRRGEVALGLLNLTDEDYHLHPLTPYQEMPRERVGYLRLRFNF